MTKMALAGLVEGERAVIEDIDKALPGYWQTTAGRLYLRLATSAAINNDKLGLVQYLCGERGVPALGDDKGDECGAFISISPSAFSFPPLPLRVASSYAVTTPAPYQSKSSHHSHRHLFFISRPPSSLPPQRWRGAWASQSECGLSIDSNRSRDDVVVQVQRHAEA